jgi:hypothetical protein
MGRQQGPVDARASHGCHPDGGKADHCFRLTGNTACDHVACPAISICMERQAEGRSVSTTSHTRECLCPRHGGFARHRSPGTVIDGQDRGR